ncbi:MAG: hypothetical protein JNK82_44110 [Myxococcaceae bacterium]|nr:hypothetical protein [Myxococcaceae bacterium]
MHPYDIRELIDRGWPDVLTVTPEDLAKLRRFERWVRDRRRDAAHGRCDHGVESTGARRVARLRARAPQGDAAVSDSPPETDGWPKPPHAFQVDRDLVMELRAKF